MAAEGIRLEARPATGPVPPGLAPDPCAIVIFGATGDLTRRKLAPALYNLALDRELPGSCALIGVSRGLGSTDEWRAQLREALGKHSRTQPIDDAVWGRLCAAAQVVSGDLGDPGIYRRVREALTAVDRERHTGGNHLFYCATPPDAFPEIITGLAGAGLITPPGGTPWTRVIVEKPFGSDLASAQELNRIAAESLDEQQIWRIDHYLGKETVQNILIFRFGNSIFEPLWNRKYIDHVQITAAEEIGVEGRGRFYDSAGVLRDIVQNHLLQTLALFLMEQPVSFGADDVRDEKAKAMRSLRLLSAEEVADATVRGQYRGYLDERGVAAGSRTPTFTALRVFVDNWRWQGVPFYLRAGKKLRKRLTEISVHFQPVPINLFGRDEVCQLAQPNVLQLRIQPDEGMALHIVTKYPGDELALADVKMDFSYAGAFSTPTHEAYERLLLDAMRGDATLYARRDAVELAWKFCDPILDAWAASPEPPAPYEPGTEGPRAASELLWRDGRSWRPIA
jgi:glucose-6-phosphate 1-dehydrogenase